MLDINDFIAERGGDVKKIKESQRRRHAPEEVVDEVIAMFEDHRKCGLSRVTERSVDAADAVFLYSPICRKPDQD
jgi:seryl-tRNA synthetase